MKLRMKELINEVFGGITQLRLEIIEATGENITRKMVEKWIEREAIPMGRWMTLVDLAAEKGVQLKLEDWKA